MYLSEIHQFAGQKFIPPGLLIYIEMILAMGRSFFVGQDDTKNYVIQILSAKLLAWTTKFSPAAVIAFEKRMLGSPDGGYVHRYIQPCMIAHTILKEQKEFSLKIGDKEHAMPQRVLFCFLDDNALGGSIRTNNFNMILPDIESVKLRTADKVTYIDIPGYLHTPNRVDYRELYNKFRRNRDRPSLTADYKNIPIEIWKNGYALFSYDLSSAGTENSQYLSQPTTGPHYFDFTFAKQMEKNMICLVLNEVPRSWLLHQKTKFVTFR